MNNSLKLLASVVLILGAAGVLAWYFWPHPTAGANQPVQITCLTCQHSEGTTWDEVVKHGDHRVGEVSGWFLTCKKCGKTAFAHNTADPIPEKVKQIARQTGQ